MSLRNFLDRLRQRILGRGAHQPPRSPGKLRVIRLEDRRLLDARFGIGVAGVLMMDGFDLGDSLVLDSGLAPDTMQFQLTHGSWFNDVANPDLQPGGRASIDPTGKILTIDNSTLFGPTITGIEIDASNPFPVYGTSTLNTGELGSVTSGPLGFDVSSLTIDGGGIVDLQGLTTDFDTLSVTGTSLTVSDVDDLELDHVSLTGSLNVSAAGELTDSTASTITVGLDATFTATSITLGDDSSDTTNFGSLAFAATGSVDITEDSDMNLTGDNSADSLSLSSNGSIINDSTSLAADVYVDNGETFGGTGVVNGRLTVKPGGTLAPGSSPGEMTVDALNLESGSIFEVEINGVASTDYDRVVVSNADNPDAPDVFIDDAILSVSLNGFTPTPGQQFTIIDNEGTDTVADGSAMGSGIFHGLDEGDVFRANGGEVFYISYVGGDGNDVVLTVGDTLVTINAGVLEITDIGAGGSNDDLTITFDDLGDMDPANDRYVISDSLLSLAANIPGAIQISTTSVSVLASSVTGGKILFNTGDGDDTLTIDLSGGNLTHTIVYNGGGQTTADGDALIITGATVDTVTHTLIDAASGTIDITGNAQIQYNGLEPVVDHLIAADRLFSFSGGAETITLSDDAGDLLSGYSFIDSDLSESVTFVNPTNSLTIATGGGSGADVINIQGLDSSFAADLTVTADSDVGEEDTVNFQTAAVSVGNLSVVANDIAIKSAVTTSGTFALTATNDVSLAAGVNAGGAVTVNTTSGNIDFAGGSIVAAGQSVALSAATGAILGHATAGLDVRALNLETTALNGIGATDALETDVTNLTFNNSDAATQTNISNRGALIIAGASSFGGGGTVSAGSPMTINASVTSALDFTLQAEGDGPTNADTDDLTINASVTHTGGNVAKTIHLLADDDVIFGAGTVGFTTDNAGDIVNVTADAATVPDPDANLTGSITFNGGVIDATLGTVNLATNVSGAGGGAIVNTSGAGTDVTAGTVNLVARSGIGATGAIETNADNVAFRNTENAVQITEVNAATFTGTNASNGAVTLATTLGNLTVGAADIVTNGGAVVLNAVQAGADVIFALNGQVRTNNTVAAGAAVTVIADDLRLDAAGGTLINAGTSGLVTLRPQNAAREINLGNGAVDGAVLAITDVELDRITTGGGVTIGGNTQTGNITVVGAADQATGATITGGTFLLDASGNTTATITVNADLSNDIATTFKTSGGNIVLGGGSVVTTNDTITFSDPVQLAANVNNVSSGAGAGDVLFNGTINADNSTVVGQDRTLTVNAGTGTALFAASVGTMGSGQLADLDVTAALTRFGGNVQIDDNTAPAATATITGAVQLDGNVVFDLDGSNNANDKSLTITGTLDADGAAAHNRSFGVSAGTGTVTLQDSIGTIQALSDLNLIGGTIVFGGNGTAVTIDVTDDVTGVGIGPQTVFLGGDVRLDDNVRFLLDATVDRDVDLNGTVNSLVGETNDLRFSGGAGTDIEISGSVGGSNQLGAILVDNGGSIAFNGAVAASTFTVTAATQVDLANVVANDIDVTATGIDLNGTTYTANNDDVDFRGAVDLDAIPGTITVTAGGQDGDDVLFTSTIDDTGSNNTLNIVAALGAATITQAAGGTNHLAALTVTSAAQADLNSVTAGSIAITATNIDLNGPRYHANAGSAIFSGAVDLDAAAGQISVSSGGVVGQNIQFTSTLNDADSNNTLVVNSGLGDTQFQGAVGSSSAPGSLTIANAADVNFQSTLAAGSLIQTAGTGTTNFNGGSVGGNVKVATVNVAFTSGTLTATGTADIATSGAITGAATTGVADLTGTVITLSSGATGIGASDKPLELFASTRLDASTTGGGSVFVDGIGNLNLGQVNAGTGTAALSATERIVDARTGEGSGNENIIAGSTALTAVTGIGTGALSDVGDIDLTVTNVAFRNSTSGVVNLENNGALIITDVDGLTSSAAAAGGSVTASSPLMIAHAVATGDSMIFIAGDDNTADNDDLTIAAAVQLDSTTNSTLTFQAGDDVIIQSAGSVTTSDSVNDAAAHTVIVTADNEGTTGTDTDRGSVTQVSTTAVAIQRTTGTVTLVIDSADGVGDSSGDAGTTADNALRTNVDFLDVDNTLDNDIAIIESNSVSVVHLDQDGANDTILLTASGSITVVDDTTAAPVVTVLAGTVTFIAEGATSDVTLNDALETMGGDVVIDAGRNVTSTAAGTITTTAAADSGVASGSVTIRSALGGAGATGDIDLDGAIDTRGASNGGGTGSAGGAVQLSAFDNDGGSITVDGTIQSVGGSGATGPGVGARVAVDADGDIDVNAGITTGGGFDGATPLIRLVSNFGEVRTGVDGDLSTSNALGLSSAGFIDVFGTLGVNLAGDLDSSGVGTNVGGRDISIQSFAGGLTTSGVIIATGGGGTSSGGAVSLRAFDGDVRVDGTIDSRAMGTGGEGPVSIIARDATVAAPDVGNVEINARIDAESVIITSDLDVTIAAPIESASFDISLNVGRNAFINQSLTTFGGSVVIDAGNNVTGATAGTITTTASADSGVASGNVTIRSALGGVGATGDIDLDGAIDTRGASNSGGTGSSGGAVQLSAFDNDGGSITVDGTIQTAGGSGTTGPGLGARVAVDADGDIEVNAGITTGGGFDGATPLIRLVSNFGEVRTGIDGDLSTSNAVGLSSAGFIDVFGNLGVNLAGDLNSSGVGTNVGGRDISIQSFAGGVTTSGAITATGGGGTSGGGAVNLRAFDGDVRVDGTIDSRAMGTGGEGLVSIIARDASVPVLDVGNVEINARIDGESVVITSDLDVTIAAPIESASFDISLNVGRNAFINQSLTTFGGSVVIDAGNNVTGATAGTITTTASADSGVASGNVTIRSALGGTGATGDIVLDGTIDTRGTTVANAGTNGANVTLNATTNAGGLVDVAEILTGGGAGTNFGLNGGQAGAVDVDADGSVTLGTVAATGGNGRGNGGAGNTVNVGAGGAVDLTSVNTSGGSTIFDLGGNAATVTVVSTGGAINVTNISANGGSTTDADGGADAAGNAANISLSNVGVAANITLRGLLHAVGGTAPAAAQNGAEASVLVTSGGAILDGSGSETPNIAAGSSALRAATGIGANPGSTDDSADIDLADGMTVAAQVNLAGDINLSADDANTATEESLTIGTVDGLVGVSIDDGNAGTTTDSGNIRLAATLDLTINSAVTVAGATGNIFASADCDGDLLVNAPLTAGSVNGGFEFHAQNFGLAAGQAITANGTGGVTIVACRTIVLNTGSSITAVDGLIDLDAGSDPLTPNDNFTAITIDGATVQTTGTGNIDIDGVGIAIGANAGTSNNHGVHLLNGGVVQTTGTGAISLTGVAAGATTEDALIDDATSSVRTVSGGITITGLQNDVAMTDGGRVLSNTGDAVIRAAGNVLLGTVDLDFDDATTVGAGTVIITADFNTSTISATNGIASDGNGVILDNLTGETAADINITATAAALRAGSGVGTDLDDINTATMTDTGATFTLAAATGSGDVNVTNSGSFTVGTVVHSGTATFTQVSTTDGLVKLEAIDGDLIVATQVIAGGDNNATLTTTNSGNVVLTAATTAAENQVTVNSAGNISGGALVTAATIDLDAATGIGDADAVELAAATTISADTITGNIDLDHAAVAATTVTSLTTGVGVTGGDISFAQTGNQRVTLTSVSTINGNVTIKNAGGTNADIDVGTISASDADGGNDDIVILVGEGAIADVLATEAANVTANEVAFTAENGIGTNDDINTAVDFVAAVTESGSIHLRDVDSLQIDAVGMVTGLTITDSDNDNSRGDDITVVTTGELVATEAVANNDGGNVSLRANTGLVDPGNVLVFAEVGVTDGDADVDTDGNITLTADDGLIVAANVTNDAGGTITGTALGPIFIDPGSLISTEDGGIILTANLGGTFNGSFNGVSIDSATVQSTTGDITINGTAGDDGGANDGVDLEAAIIETATGNIFITGKGGTSAAATDSNNDGVTTSDTRIESTAGGNITVTGFGGAGSNSEGVEFEDSTVSSGVGNIMITGFGGADGDFNSGVDIDGDATFSLIETTSGSITIMGAGGAFGDENFGIQVQDDSIVRSTTGTILLDGAGGAGGDLLNVGVGVYTGGSVRSLGTGVSTAMITIIGDGGGVLHGNYGVLLEDSGSRITSVDGAIEITGRASATALGDDNVGVLVLDGGEVSSTGVGKITITGTALTGDNSDGVAIDGTDAAVRSVNGAISISGTSAADEGVEIVNGGLVTASAGNVRMEGTGGTAGDAGVEVSSGGGVTSTGTATVTLVGTAGTAANGVQIGSAASTSGSVTSAGGAILLDGSATTGNGVAVIGGSHVTAAGDATVTLNSSTAMLIDASTVSGVKAVLLTSDDNAGAGDDIIFRNASVIESVDSTVVILSGDSVLLQTGSTIASGGPLTIAASNMAADALGAVTMHDGTNVTAHNASLIDVTATEDIAISAISTVGGEVQIESTAGGIVDADGAAGNDITAMNVALRAATGIGSVNAIETTVTNLAFSSTIGDVNINNSGDLNIVNVDGLAASSAASGNVNLTASGTVTFAASLSASGNIVVNATDSAGGTEDIEVTGGFTVESNGTGNITFNAGDAITVNDGATVQATASESQNITLNSGAADAGDGGSMRLEGALLAGTTSGIVTLNLNATLTGQNAAQADSGSIVTDQLLLLSTGDAGVFDLDQSTANDVDDIAAGTAGAITFQNSVDLKVGSVNGTDGITTSDDNVTLCATSITLAAAIAIGTGTTGGDLRLAATGPAGSIVQTSDTITARKLGVRATDGVNLSLTNDVSEFAGDSGNGSLTLVDVNGYTIGAVDREGCFAAVSGLTSGGDFESCAGSGDIVLTSAVNVTGTVRLEATTGSVTQDMNGVINAGNLGMRAAVNIDFDVATGGNNIGGILAAASTAGGFIEFADNDGFTVGTIAMGTCFDTTVGVTSANGDVTLSSADGSITIENVVTAGTSGAGDGNVNLQTTTSGNVVLNAAISAADDTVTINSVDAINGAGLVTTNSVDLDAGSGIGDSTEGNLSVANIDAVNAAGDVNLNNSLMTSVFVTNLTTDSGDVTFDQSGGGDVSFLSASTTTTGNIRLNNAAGSLTAASVTTETGHLNLGAIDGDVTATSVSTSDGGIGISAAGGNITATSVTAGTAADGDGDVNLTTTTSGGMSGSIFVGNVYAGADALTVTSVGSIDEVAGVDPDADLTADTVELIAATGIGTTGQLEIDARTLAGTTASGDIRLQDTAGDITIGAVGITSGLAITAGAATDHLTLRANGSITVNEAVSNTGGGNVLLSAEGAGNDITADEDVSASGGHVTLMSADAIELTDRVTVSTTNHGTIHIDAGTGAFTMAAGAELQSGDGDIHADASLNVTVGRITTSANVALTSDAASIVDTAGDSAVDISASGLRLSAAVGGGESTNHLETTVATISARAATGGIFVRETDAIAVSNVAASTQKVNGDGTSTTRTDAAQSDLVTTADGAIVLSTANGSITLNDGTAGTVASGDGIAVSASGVGNVRIAADNAATNIVASADVNGGSGSVTISAGNNVTLNADVSVADSGAISIEAVDGSVTLNDDSDLDETGITTATGDILITAAIDVTLSADVTSTTGNIGIGAGNHISQTSGAVVADIKTNGDASLAADNAITMDVGTSIDAGENLIATATNGNIRLGLLDATNVSLDATSGSVLDNNGGSTANVRATNLRITAGTSIGLADGNAGLGTNDNAIDTDVEKVAASAASGIYLQELAVGGDISVDSVGEVVVNVTANRVAVDGMALTANEVKFDQTLGELEDLTTTTGPVKVVAEAGSITVNEGMSAGQGITANTSGSSVLGDGDILLEARSAGNDVILKTDVLSTNGQISIIAADSITSDGDISTTGSGTIYLNAISGTFTLNDLDANDAGISAGDGNVLLQAGSTVTLGADIGTSGSGSIGVSAVGAIIQKADITSSTGNILLMTDGSLTMASGTSSTADGSTILIDAATSIDLGLLIAENVSLNADTGSITDNNGHATANVRATSLRMTAGGAIGGPDSPTLPNGTSVNDEAIDLEATNVAASAAVGIYLQELTAGADITVSSVAAQTVNVTVQQATFDSGLATPAPMIEQTLAELEDLSTISGPIKVVAEAGAITIEGGTLTPTSGVNAGTAGDVLLNARGGTRIQLDADVNSGTGHVRLLAANSVSLSADVSLSTTGSGTIDVEAMNGSFVMDSSSTISTVDGDIRIQADGDVVIGDITAANAGVWLTSVSASILDADADDADNDVSSLGLRLNAAVGVGALGSGSNNAIETDVAVLSARAGKGGMNILEANGVTVGDVTIDTFQPEFDSSTTTNAGTTQSDLRTVAHGDVVLRTQAGDILLTEGTADMGDGVISANGNGNVLISAGGTGDIIVNANITSQTGHMTLEAANQLNLGASSDTPVLVQTGGGGSIVATAGASSVVMQPDARLESMTGSIHVEAATEVIVGRIQTQANVAITANGGSIMDADGTADTMEDIIADGLRLNSTGTIGDIAGDNAMETQVVTVAAKSAGVVHLNETDDLVVGSVEVMTEHVDFGGTTTTITDAPLLGIDSTSRDILVATGETLTLSRPLNAGTADTRLVSGKTISQTSDGVITAKNFVAILLATASDQNISLGAADNVIDSLAIRNTSEGGDITVFDSADDLTISEVSNPAISTIPSVIPTGIDTKGVDANAGSINITSVGDLMIDENVNAANDNASMTATIPLQDESITLISRQGNITLSEDTTISTDENPEAGNFVDVTGDSITIIAGATSNSGTVSLLNNSEVRTDAGVARQIAPRPTAFAFSPTVGAENAFVTLSDAESMRANLSFIPGGFLGILDLVFGVAGEENLEVVIDWGAVSQTSFTGIAGDAAETGSGALEFSIADADKTIFYVDEGSRQYLIPHLYKVSDMVTSPNDRNGREINPTIFGVRFSVAQHESINIWGQSAAIPGGTSSETPDPFDFHGTTVEIQDASGGTIALQSTSLALLSSTDTNPLREFTQQAAQNGLPLDNLEPTPNGTPEGRAEWEFVAGPAPGMAPTELQERVESEIRPVEAQVDVQIFSEIVTDVVFGAGATSDSAVGTEVYLQIRRRFELDDDADVVIDRIKDNSFVSNRESFEEFVRSRPELTDGAGYEIWLITETGGQTVERPIVQFEITGGRPGPATEELPETFEPYQLRELDFEEQPEEPPAVEPADVSLKHDLMDADHDGVVVDGDAGQPSVSAISSASPSLEARPVGDPPAETDETESRGDAVAEQDTVDALSVAVPGLLFTRAARWKRKQVASDVVLTRAARIRRRMERPLRDPEPHSN